MMVNADAKKDLVDDNVINVKPTSGAILISNVTVSAKQIVDATIE